MACETTLSRTKRPFTKRYCASREARVNPGAATNPEIRTAALAAPTSTADCAKSSPTMPLDRSRGEAGAR